MLYDLITIREMLDERFSPLEPELTGFRMIDSKFRPTDLKRISERLRVNFPSDFEKVLLFCDLGNLTIGPTVFGNGRDYERVLENYNIAPESRWWTIETKPSSILLVAVSDSFAIALDCQTGEVIAFSNEQTIESGIVIASNFRDFFCGLGTIFFERMTTSNSEALGQSIAQAVKSKNHDFWLQLAK